MSSKANLFEAGSSIEWMLIDIYCPGRSDTNMLGVGVGYDIRVDKLEVDFNFDTLDFRRSVRYSIVYYEENKSPNKECVIH